MTNKSALRSPLQRVPWSTIVALSICVGGGSPAFAADGPACKHDNPNPQLYAPDSEPFGKSMLSWSEEQWRWIYAVPAAQNPNLTPGASIDDGQHGPVIFIPGSFAATPSTAPVSYAIPRHKAIGFSPVGLVNDYPCPDPTYQPAPGQSLYDFLMAGILPLVDTAQLTATLDGVPLTNLLAYHYNSDRLFYVTGDVSLQSVFDSCITGSRQPAVSASYFFIIKELPPGHHQLVNSIVTTGGVTYGPYTTNLEVE